MINALRGEFEAAIGGDLIAFDTALGTVATIEERCGDLPIVELVNKAVFGRRARDQMALLAAAIAATGRSTEEAATLAARASVAETERFILALMGALGFEVTRAVGEGAERPLDGANSGDVGGSSRSAG